jgi:hypothetical protein
VKAPKAKRAAGEGKAVKVKALKVKKEASEGKVKVLKVKKEKVAGEVKAKVVKVKKEKVAGEGKAKVVKVKKEKKEKEAGEKVKAPRKKRAPKAGGVPSTEDDLALIRALAGCAGGAPPEDDGMDSDMHMLAAALAGEASAADHSHENEWLPASEAREARDNSLAAALADCAEEDDDVEEEEGEGGDELSDPFYRYAIDPAGDMLGGMFDA